MILDIVSVFSFALMTIGLHIIMPSPKATMDVSVFDSIFVKCFGFSFVATVYFVILFLHILWVIKKYAIHTKLGKWKTGISLGMLYALLYMGGMQEVIVSASFLSTYGIDFIIYEFFMGLADAIPAFLLCLFLCCRYALLEKNQIEMGDKENYIRIIEIVLSFFIWRLFGYITGITDSEFSITPIPVLVWTFVFGMIFGIGYCMIQLLTDENRGIDFFYIMGINWIWFNCYIGLIAKNTFLLMFIRSGLDVMAIMTGSYLVEKRIK
ncbi:hypothetical protein [Floccifex sp.]|uniref:hypothetical protein n=1 Tax=Floccifex sp. TaxID=2815810 RepID=UPI003F006570